MAKGYVIKARSIFRADLQAHPLDKFVFGDNMRHRGMGGLAKEMRGEPNAVGIPTKWAPLRTPGAYFRDHDWNLPEVRNAIMTQWDYLKYHIDHDGNVIFPITGIGTGKAQLDVTAPEIFKQLNLQLRELIAFSDKLAIVAITVPLAYISLTNLTEGPDNVPNRTGTARRRVVILSPGTG